MPIFSPGGGPSWFFTESVEHNVSSQILLILVPPGWAAFPILFPFGTGKCLSGLDSFTPRGIFPLIQWSSPWKTAKTDSGHLMPRVRCRSNPANWTGRRLEVLEQSR